MKRLCCSCRSQFAWIVPPRVFSIGTSSKCTLPLLIAFHKQHWPQLSMLLISHWSFPLVRPCHHPHGFMHSRCSEGFIKGWIPYSFNPSQNRQIKIHNLENKKMEIKPCQNQKQPLPSLPIRAYVACSPWCWWIRSDKYQIKETKPNQTIQQTN